MELDDVLRRTKFDRYVSEQTRLEFLYSLLHGAEVVPISTVITDCRDPKDNKFLEVAVSGNATDVVSGDRDLLVLSPFRGIDVLAVDDFLLKRNP
jgi:putative PIN family toxin of toxin-antitoxin system